MKKIMLLILAAMVLLPNRFCAQNNVKEGWLKDSIPFSELPGSIKDGMVYAEHKLYSPDRPAYNLIKEKFFDTPSHALMHYKNLQEINDSSNLDYVKVFYSNGSSVTYKVVDVSKEEDRGSNKIKYRFYMHHDKLVLNNGDVVTFEIAYETKFDYFVRNFPDGQITYRTAYSNKNFVEIKYADGSIYKGSYWKYKDNQWHWDDGLVYSCFQISKLSDLTGFKYYCGTLKKPNGKEEEFYCGESKAALEAERLAKENAKKKAEAAKLANFTKRLGYNPKGTSIGKLMSVGRSISAVIDYLAEYGVGGFRYFINLKRDSGSSKIYYLYMKTGEDWLGTWTGTYQAKIYTKNGRITSVQW